MQFIWVQCCIILPSMSTMGISIHKVSFIPPNSGYPQPAASGNWTPPRGNIASSLGAVIRVPGISSQWGYDGSIFFRLRGATDVIASLCLVSILHFLGVPHLDPDEYIHGICSEETSRNGEPIGEPIGIYATERISVNHWISMSQVGNTWFWLCWTLWEGDGKRVDMWGGSSQWWSEQPLGKHGKRHQTDSAYLIKTLFFQAGGASHFKTSSTRINRCWPKFLIQSWTSKVVPSKKAKLVYNSIIHIYKPYSFW